MGGAFGMKNKLPVILIIAGLILRFAFSGESYIAYLLIFIAAMILLFKYAGKTVKRIVAVILALGVAYFAFVEVPIIKAASGDTELSADYLIVLGAAVHGDRPSLSMRERCGAAAEYLSSNPDCVAIVSGGQGNDENISEAEAMRVLLIDSGIEDSRIIVEDKSTSTYENLLNSSEFIEDDAVIAVCTSEYHLYRAKLIGRGLGLELIGVPARTGYLSVRTNYFIREAFGVTYQWIFG